MRHADRFDLPKGYLEEGETELQCALRELREETGVAADAVEIDEQFRFTTEYTVMPKRHGPGPALKTVAIFLGRLTRPVEIRLTEHLGFEWVPWRPPHRIQMETIDPLLEQVAEHLARCGE